MSKTPEFLAKVQAGDGLTIHFMDQAENLLAEAHYGLLDQDRNGLPVKVQALAASTQANISTSFGIANRQNIERTILVGENSLSFHICIDQYPAWPDAVFLNCKLINDSSSAVTLVGINAPMVIPGPVFHSHFNWSFQGPAVHWGQDFAFPLPADFSRQNSLEHEDHGETGGIPLVYLWNQRVGVSLAHVETLPQHGSLPVQAYPLQMGYQYTEQLVLESGGSFTVPQIMLSFHQGDFFEPLALYREILAKQGLVSASPNHETYEPAWCSWGYEFDVRPDEMLGVIPALKKLGIHWMTLDDRWFDAYGDWNPRPETFPGGSAQIRQMVAEIHRQGCLAQLWWYPLAVEDGQGSWDSHTYQTAAILKEHPDWLILNPDGSPARNNRGLAILDPSLPEVQQYTAALTRLFIQDWGFDGHKLDNIFTVPPCYNPAHYHARPEESWEGMEEVYRQIFEITRSLKPESVTQICPCGTPPWLPWLAYMDQAVTADPVSSLQVRQRIKFYKALLGSNFPVFADHVELTDLGSDFASEVGSGGVLATKFVWPPDETLRSRLQEYWALDDAKLPVFEKWFGIDREHHLADGEYLNAYDLAFDLPETHLIRKGEKMYYGFFAPAVEDEFSGKIELRGLDHHPYALTDYVNDVSLGIVSGPEAMINVNFKGSLLIMAVPLP